MKFGIMQPTYACVVDGPTEVKVGMYINEISRHGRASFQIVVCLYQSK